MCKNLCERYETKTYHRGYSFIIKINPKDKKVGNIHNKIWRLIFKQAEVLKHI